MTLCIPLGVAIQIDRRLGHSTAWALCRRHKLEILLKAGWDFIHGKTTGKEDTFCKNLKKQWGELAPKMKSAMEAFDSTSFVGDDPQCLEFAERLVKLSERIAKSESSSFLPRSDYSLFLDLGLVSSNDEYARFCSDYINPICSLFCLDR